MRCLLCENLSFKEHICKACQQNFLTPSLFRRKLPNGIEVISFYPYNDIKELLFSKHTDLGYHIFKLLAKQSFTPFAQALQLPHPVASIGVDDHVRYGYAHTALLNHALKSQSIKPLYNKLRASKQINYSGKSKSFRLANPRDFVLKPFADKEVILVDDIITTGTTLTEAIATLQAAYKEVLFCLTLSDVREN